MRISLFIVLMASIWWNAMTGPGWLGKQRGTADPDGSPAVTASGDDESDDRGAADPNG